MQAERHKAYDALSRDKESKAFYNTKAWIDTRNAVLNERPICELCKENLANQVHHVIPLTLDRSKALDQSNLMSLDEKCHKRIEAYRRMTGDECGLPEMFDDDDR